MFEIVIRLGVCFECGSPDNIHKHHVIPKSRGGIKTLPLCEICHGKVHDLNYVNHSNLIRTSLLLKKQRGELVGRRSGSTESADKFLQKPSSLKIIGYLHQGYSCRYISKLTGHGTQLVMKVRKLLKKTESVNKESDIWFR